MAEAALIGFEIARKLQDAGIISEGLHISRIVIDIKVEETVAIYYETLADKVTIDFCLDTLIQHKDLLVVKKVVERMED